MIVSVLSQKGGVGKSTLARLVAAAYAEAGWRVKIADLNTRQLTAVEWVAQRLERGDKPELFAEAFAKVREAIRQRVNYDLLVFDGRPDSDVSSLEAARLSTLVLVPTGTALDDLKPQTLFAEELVAKGVQRSRILFVLNQVADSDVAVADARRYLKMMDFRVARCALPHRTGYQMAQNDGLALYETLYPPLNERAAMLANELVEALTSFEEMSA